ncbi:hypothetical protein [Sabulibacter ruber]|uniref:hypothetical protein n=1 Tax=Sabulibacter ruber TaxID=2811901 RepID=UPI001A96DB9E|nr:hypothetical protein [Sabulibacter ruber]
MRNVLLAFLAAIVLLPMAAQAQTTLSLAHKPAPRASLNLSLPASTTQKTDPYLYSKKGDTFLLLGIGLNILSAGSYLMVPNFYKKPYDPTTDYLYRMDVAKNNPAVIQQIEQWYDEAMVTYNRETAQRNRKVRNARYACAAAFTLGVAFDIAAIKNFKKGKQ